MPIVPMQTTITLYGGLAARQSGWLLLSTKFMVVECQEHSFVGMSLYIDREVFCSSSCFMDRRRGSDRESFLCMVERSVLVCTARTYYVVPR